MADSYTCPKCHIVSYNPNDIKNLYCGACHTFAQDLRDEPVTTFEHICPTKLTRRDCFSLAILTLLESSDNSEARLVHGWVRDSFNPGRYVEHAWCEFPAVATYSDGTEAPITVVVDYSQLDENARIWPREEIYKAMGVRDCKYFTHAEAVALALRFGCDGPWKEEPNDQ